MLNPGPELDALVAELVMWPNCAQRSTLDVSFNIHSRKAETPPIPKYSTSLEAAYELLTSTKSRFVWGMSLSSASGESFKLCRAYPDLTDHWVEYMTPSGLKKGAVGQSMPHAICIAAIEAVVPEVCSI